MSVVLHYIFKYPIELILLTVAIIITTLVLFLYPVQKASAVIEKPEISVVDNQQKKITIDIAGAVEKPDVYKLAHDSSLHDVIEVAGGLSRNADREFIARNFNMAESLRDKQKIYIPSKDEVENGIFNENLGKENLQTNPPASIEPVVGISINTSTLDELDTLPGIGPTTAQKIVDNRPYTSVDELLSKKVTSSSTFNKIKDMVKL